MRERGAYRAVCVCETEIVCLCYSTYVYVSEHYVRVCVRVRACVLCVIFMHAGKEGMVGKQTAKLPDEVQRVQFDSGSLHFHRDFSSLKRPHPQVLSSLPSWLSPIYNKRRQKKNKTKKQIVPKRKNLRP